MNAAAWCGSPRHFPPSPREFCPTSSSRLREDYPGVSFVLKDVIASAMW